MPISYRQRQLAIRPFPTAAGEVCPNITRTYRRTDIAHALPPPPVKNETNTSAEIPATSQWAAQTFGINLSEKQTQLVDSDSKYLMACFNRQGGKTTAAAIKALHRCLHYPGHIIVVISRSLEQAGILIQVFSDMAVRLGYRIRRVLGNRHSFALPNGSQIRAVAHNEDTSAGRTANVLIVDEAARVWDKVYTTVSAFVSRSHGSLWLLSTPKGQTGFFYNYWHNKDESWQRIFSNVDECPDLDPEYLRIQKLADPITYAQDFECKFIQPGGFLTTREFIDQMIYTPEEERDRLPLIR